MALSPSESAYLWKDASRLSTTGIPSIRMDRPPFKKHPKKNCLKSPQVRVLSPPYFAVQPFKEVRRPIESWDLQFGSVTG
jgi:hypothetical protein